MMDRELIENKLQEIQEETRKLINDAYICGYKDGYLECTCHKGMAMNESSKTTYGDFQMSTISVKNI